MDIATLGLQVDASGAIKATRNLGGELGTLGKQSGDVADKITASFKRLAAGITVGAALGKLVRDTAEAQRVSAILNQTIVTTQQAADRTTAEVEALAASLARLSTQSGTAVQGGLTRLLTYTTIQGETFDRAAQAAVDMAAALGGDLTQAAETVGKALGSPEFALSALSKQGFRFTQEQQTLIKALVEAGRVAEAQAIILDELESVYAGAALAARDTFGGALAALKNSFGELFEASSGATRGITAFLNYLTTFVQVVNRSGDAMRQLGAGIVVAAGAYVIYTKQAEIALARTAILAGAQTIAGFVNLAKSIGLAAAAMDLLGKAGPLKLVTIGVSVAGAAAAFLGLKKIIGETNDEFTKFTADVEAAAQRAAQGFSPTAPGMEAGVVGSDVAQQAAARIRAAEQELALARLTADAAAEQAIRNTAINDTIKARADLSGQDLAITLNAIRAEERLALAAERARQARAVNQESQDRIRAARQALDLAAAEGEAAALLAVEQKAVNAEIDARRRLSGDALDTILRAIALEKELATVLVQQNAIRQRTTAREGLRERIDAQAREIELTRAQIGALNQSEQAYRGVVTQQKVAAAIAKEEAAAKAANITLTDAERAAIAANVEEMERLERVMRALLGLTPAERDNPFAIPDAPAGVFADQLAQALSAAQGLAVAFGEVGRSLGQAIGQAAQLATNVSRLQEIASQKDAAGNAIGIGAALGTAGGASAALGIVGATVAVADALDLFGTRAKQRAAEMAEAARQFNRALEDFAIGTRTTLDGDLRDNLRRANDLIRDAAKATGVTLGNLPDFGSSDDFAAYLKQFEAIIGVSKQAETAFAPFVARLRELLNITKANEAALAEQNRERVAQGLEDLEVRRLVAQGLQAAADAERVRLAGIREIAKAEAEFGKDSPYVAALREVVRAEEEAAAAARARAEAVAAETARRTREDFGLRALDVLDPQAGVSARFYADQARELFDAIQDGLDDATIDALRFAQALEAAAFEIAKIEEALRVFEGLFERGLRATGQTARADQFAFDARQRQEFADAVRAGMSESTLALLEFVQFAEREQFLLQQAIAEQTAVIREAADRQVAAITDQIGAIKRASDLEQRAFREQIDATRRAAQETAAVFQGQIDSIRASTKAQTDAIDEQIRMARDAMAVQREQLQAAQQQLGLLARAADALTKLRDDLGVGQFSPLSPEDQLTELRRRFETLVAAADGGNATAAAQVPEVARALLTASRGFFGSGPGFVEEFTRVQDAVSRLADRFGSERDAQQRLVTAAEQSLRAQERSVQALQQQKDAIQRSAAEQIAALQARKDAAAKEAADTIQMLQDFAAAAKAGADEQIETLTETRDAIIAAADAQIALITDQLTAITQARIEAHEYYRKWEELSSGAWEDQYRVAEEGKQAAMDAVTEMRNVGEAVRSGMARLADELERNRNVAVAASTQETAELQRSNRQLAELVAVTRLAAAGPRR